MIDLLTKKNVNVNSTFTKEQKKVAKAKYSTLKERRDVFQHSWNEIINQILTSKIPNWGSMVLYPNKGTPGIRVESK